MQIVINLDDRLARKVGVVLAASAGLAVVLVGASARASNVTVPNSFSAGQTASASQVNANFAAVQAAVNDNNARIAALETLLAGVTRAGGTITFSGVNVQIVNGSGATTTANGSGNLIVGYNEDPGPAATRTGSHNLILGTDHTYTSTGGLLSGVGNTVTAANAINIGGTANSAAGQYSVIVGGDSNTITDGGSAGSNGKFATIFGSHAASNGNGDWEGRYAESLQNNAGVAFGSHNFESDFGFDSFLCQLGNKQSGSPVGQVKLIVGFGADSLLLAPNVPAVQIARTGTFSPPANGISIGESSSGPIEIGKSGTGASIAVPGSSTVTLGP